MPAGFSSAARRFASPHLKARLQSRLAELGGLALGIAGIGLGVALATYAPSDPSFDTAATGPVHNLAGPPGADVADLLLQWFGVAGALPALCLLAWAWRIAAHRGLGSVTLRLLALFLALPTLAAVCGAVPALLGRQSAQPYPWPSPAGPGGATGDTIAANALAAGRGLLGTFGGGLVWLFVVVLALLLTTLALGLSGHEWRRVAAAGGRSLALPFRLVPRKRDPGDDEARRVRDEMLAARLSRERMEAGSVVGAGGRSSSSAIDVGDAAAGPAREPGSARALLTRGGERRAEPVLRIGMRARAAEERRAGEPAAAPARDRRGPTSIEPVTTALALRDADGAVGAPAGRAAGRADAAAGDRHAVIALAGPTAPPPASEAPAAAPAAAPDAFPDRRAAGLRGLLAGRRLPGRGDEAPPSERRLVPETTPDALPERVPPRMQAPDPRGRAGLADPVGWKLPPVSLLRSPAPHDAFGPSPQALDANARLLETVLADYGVQGVIRDVHSGPVVSLYELEPAPGIRSARVIGLADDVARSLSVTAVRIATVPGRNVIGIEIPNPKRETVFLAELLGAPAFTTHPSSLVLALGKDIGGNPVLADLARMPHLLIAGTTGSGKSVGVNAMIASLLYRMSPDECRLILIDPKMLELSVYDGIPHLMAPVVTEPKKAVTALKWTVREMERRYRAMSQLGVRNVAGYNDKVADARRRGEDMSRRVQTGFDSETGKPVFEEQRLDLRPLPFLVVVIDEMADLMMVAGKEIESAVQRLAQMARAAGIHVVMATQRPSVDVITGTIKANFPTRISFQVISKFDSRTILGEQGAEQLLGQGDMLYMQGGGRITRVHGPFVTDTEVEEIVAYLKSQGAPDYLDEVTEADDEEPSKDGARDGSGPAQGSLLDETSLFDQAVALVAREGKASTSFIQRHLSIGYNRAAKLIEQMEKEGIVGPANHVGKREILVRRTDDEDR